MNTIPRPVQVGFWSRFNRHAKWLRLTPPVQLFLLAILMALNLGGGGKDPRTGSALMERVGSWPGFSRGPAMSLAVTNHHAFVAIGEGGLAVLDVTDPAKPVRVGAYRPPGRTERVRIMGQRAYLATSVHAGGGCEQEGWRGRLVILDVSDPTSPRFLGVYKTGDAINSFCVDGDRVFLYDGHHFHIVDVSNPARPVALHVGWPRNTWANSILWAGRQQVYAAASPDWIVVDVSQPASPTLVTNVTPVEDGIGIRAIEVVGERAYVAEGSSDPGNHTSRGRLSIYNAPAGTAPSFLGKLELTNAALSVQVAGNYAFVATTPEGVTVIDVSNPNQPVLAGAWDTPGVAVQIEIADGHAFVADYQGGLQILDIRNPTQPALAASFDTGLTSREVRVSRTKACVLSSDTYVHDEYGFRYLSEPRSRLEVLDISNPTQPALLESHEAVWDDLIAMLPGLGFDRGGAGQYVAEGYGYKNLGWEGFEINDVHDPTNTVKVGGYDTLGEVQDLRVTNHYAYVAEGWEGLEVFDVSQPTQPFPVGRVPTRGQARGVRVAGNYAYVAEGGGGLAIFSLAPGPITIIEDPASLGAGVGDTATLTVRAYGRGTLSYQWYCGESGDVSQPIPGATSATFTTSALTGASAYWVRVSSAGGVSDSRTAWVHLVPPVSVELLGLWAGSPSAPATNVSDVAVSGHYAYLADGDTVKILDVSNPEHPIPQQALDRDIYSVAVAICSNRLYTSCQIFDITTPSQPVLLGKSDGWGWGGGLVITGDYLYTGGWALTVVDVRNPAAQALVGTFFELWEGSWNGGMTWREPYAFCTRQWAGLQVLDLSVPTEPRHVGAYFPEAPASDVAVRGDFAFITEGFDGLSERVTDLAGLEVLDISDLQCPVRAAKVSLPTANNVAMMGSYACVTGDGLQIFDVGDPYHPVSVGHHQLSAETKRLQVVGNLVYVAAGEYGLAIYRVVPQLKLNPPVREGNVLRLSWLGGPGILLQEAVSLRDQDWRDVPNSEGMSSLLLSPTNTSSFFRLTKP
jgi:hypothetical protein